MITLVIGSEDYYNYQEFKRIITEEVPWEVSWAYTAKTSTGVGQLIDRYCNEIWSPMCVHSGDPSIQNHKKRLKDRNKYFMEMCSHVVVIWRGESKGALRSVINKAKALFLPLFVYDTRKGKVTVCIDEARAEELKAEYEIELAAQLDMDKVEHDIMQMLVDEYELSEHKAINVVDGIRHLKKQFKLEKDNGNTARKNRQGQTRGR